MSFTPAQPITSSQTGPHKNLFRVVAKHASTTYRKPIAEHTQQVFDDLHAKWLQRGKPLTILDSGCGRGESTHHLAKQYKGHWVIGLDQSAQRLRHPDNQQLPGNAILARCNCIDFWRLAANAGWLFDYHFLFYPNPYPKAEQLKRRWHGHPVFATMLAVSRQLEMRTNWQLYAEEFLAGLHCLGYTASGLMPYETNEPISAFERKYQASGHSLWRVRLPTQRHDQTNVEKLPTL